MVAQVFWVHLAAGSIPVSLTVLYISGCVFREVLVDMSLLALIGASALLIGLLIFLSQTAWKSRKSEKKKIQSSTLDYRNYQRQHADGLVTTATDLRIPTKSLTPSVPRPRYRPASTLNPHKHYVHDSGSSSDSSSDSDSSCSSSSSSSD